MSATNRGGVRSEGDFYRTPRWCVEALLKEESFDGVVLDPGCGDGSIALSLGVALPALRVVGVERDKSLAKLAECRGVSVFCGDFLNYAQEVAAHTPFDAAVGNPPYREAALFARAALKCVRPGGRVCFLLRLNFLGSSRKRIDLVGSDSELARVYVLSRRPSFTGNGRSDACDYAFFVWVKGWPGSPATIKVLE